MMGFKHATAAHKIKKLGSHAARLILWDLCDLVDDKTGWAYVSYDRLQVRCEVGRESIADALEMFEGMGILTRTKRSQRATRYRLNLEKLILHEHETYKTDWDVAEDGSIIERHSSQGIETPESPAKPYTGYSSIDPGHQFDDRTSCSSIERKCSSIDPECSSTIERFPSVDPSVSPSEKNSTCVVPPVLCAPAQISSPTKSKTRSTPHTSGTTVPEPQSGTSRPETHGGFVPQERSRVLPPLADWKAPWEIAREKFASGEWEDLDDVAGGARA